MTRTVKEAITIKEMTTYDISDDGKTVTLGLEYETGHPTSRRFQIPDLGTLAMTRASLIEAALRRQMRDGSFRFAYPIGSWAIEQSTDPSSIARSLSESDAERVVMLDH